MTETTDRRAISTRQQILRAAAHSFARLPFHQVGIDRLLADAELTKGAMYFHFRAKLDLALAVIEEQNALAAEVAAELLARKLSGLETLIEFSYQLAVHDLSDERCRAALHLVESMGRTGDLGTDLLESWADNLALAVRQAVAEGDVFEDCDPHHVALLLVSLYMGLRQTSELDHPQQFLGDIEKTWVLVLPGFVRPERIEYFRQFAKRRTGIVLSSVSAIAGST
ncbi:TetR family transcriptional regulator [Mycobacterium sp. 1245111.1]|uniref:TetR/AcrR family transcriptional regulator n=1 Tax=Mycobacterium sp. 1245111.1 TaxID=1834073 RepID=UPI000800AD8B|nr:TetR/AcrR family transcriptional regulator [Mycobacterium sp. 1245111.1]OBK34963.1 TetR family transcriptional regulator [Mycobacterium sp. 1245111.1]